MVGRDNRPSQLDDDDADLLGFGDDKDDSPQSYSRSPKDAYDFMDRVAKQVYRLAALSNVNATKPRHPAGRRTSFQGEQNNNWEAAEESFLVDRNDMEATFVQCCLPNSECDLKLLDLLGDTDSQLCEDYQRIMDYFRHKTLLMERRQNVEKMRVAAADDSALLELAGFHSPQGPTPASSSARRVNITDVKLSKEVDSDEEALKSVAKAKSSRQEAPVLRGPGRKSTAEQRLLDTGSPRTPRRAQTSFLSQGSSSGPERNRLKGAMVKAGTISVMGRERKRTLDSKETSSRTAEPGKFASQDSTAEESIRRSRDATRFASRSSFDEASPVSPSRGTARNRTVLSGKGALANAGSRSLNG